MEIKSFYYLDYPDTSPADPTYAASEVRVEVGREDLDARYDFEHSYAFNVYTINYLKDKISKSDKRFYVDRSVIIVDRFEDPIIKAALESILPDIENYGIKVE